MSNIDFKSIGMLILAPFIGVVYVLLLPIVGFGLLIWTLMLKVATIFRSLLI